MINRDDRWPTEVVLERVSQQIAGEIVMSEKPGSAMRKWREIFEINQLELSRRMGVSPSVISDYEKGRRNPGSAFIRRFVNALIDIDAERGLTTLSKLSRIFNLSYLGAVIDMHEFERGIPPDDVIVAVDGVLLNSNIANEYIYGFTIIDSIKAILSLTGNEFMSLLGSTAQRVVVFTKVTTGRSPMIALRLSIVKPSMIVLHGSKKVDTLAMWIAENENIPIVLSTKSKVEDLVIGLRRLSYAQARV